MTPTQDNREAWRNVPWGGSAAEEDWIILGEDLSAATWAMQIRPAPGDTATPLVSLTNAAAGVQGISASWDAGYSDPETGATVGATRVRPLIDKATLQAIPAAADPMKSRILHFDLIGTPSGGQAAIFAAGMFVLNPGVTI